MIKENSILSYSNVKEIYNRNKSFITKTIWNSGYIFSDQLLQFEINLPSSMIKEVS